MAANQRPKFNPEPCGSSSNAFDGWTPLITCAANFPIEVFEIAISQLVHHPEYNSTLILRSDVIADTTAEFSKSLPVFEGLQAVRCIHRKLLPRRPGRDPSLEQYCTLYTSSDTIDTLVLTPIVKAGSSLPYYHPTVLHLAFRYLKSDPPMLQIDVVPLSGTPLDLNSRLYRTCLALLETLHRYGWGAVTNYKKRVNHDCLVPRDEYQDLYLIMRERHKHLVDTWKEVTDPLKHVFEDIGIATYLMLFWKITFSARSIDNDLAEPWKAWPRPPGGFLDIGCGNGLLTHILVTEGYAGYGIDLRARTSWMHYPESTQAALQVHAFDPTAETLGPAAERYFQRGVFIIGNHADELTPWVPVLSTLHKASGYISIPCCSWAFDIKFERSSTPAFQIPHADFAETLNLGGEGSNKSSYSMYRIWLASLSLHCGWEVECETLRIPSTRNWAIIGRRHLESTPEAEALENVRAIIGDVKSRALFKTRTPEGKAGDH
ncbi:DUF1613-domain-containing protein [Pholiota conissans]|uniref:tRNA (uracil-O(2)-)-methyltransferase n=1 Tax=Pholiota conissans TaxID=109636 RepID=A0A9P5YU27_9AGAR|nr:DUF1613-domain-containing protein [Pholiota conissans]